MPPQEARVWTTARKVYGNVLPLVVASPLLYQAAVAYGRGGPSVVLIYWIAAFLAMGAEGGYGLGYFHQRW